MTEPSARTAFDSRASVSERICAAADLQKTYLPTGIDTGNVSELAGYLRDQYLEAEPLRKAQILPFTGQRRESRQRGMRSVLLDRLQVMAYGDYFERPSSASFSMLRAMVEQTPVLNAVILTRSRQVQRFCNPQEGDSGPGFRIAHVDPEHNLTAEERSSIRLLSQFLNHCGWEMNPRRRRALHRDNFPTFLAKLVRESLVYDAAAIETEPRRGGRGIDGLYALDGSTIRLCTEEGYRGDDSIFAVQVISGQVLTAYTTADLIYEPRNPRADVRLAGYGMGETELLIRVVTGFLNAMTYNSKGFDDNSIPQGILHLVGEYSNEDLVAFRRYWNAMVRGINNRWTLPVLTSRDPASKASFERLGIDFNEMHFSKWMTFLVSIICAVYGMSPAEINFDSFTAGNTSALSGSDTAEKLAVSRDSGLRPLMAYLEGLFSDFIVTDYSDKLVFRWTGLDPEDAEKRHELRKAVLTVNEVRAQEGYGPLDSPLGNAPLNPSLVGPWMQLQQAAEQKEGEGADRQSKPPQDDGEQGEASGDEQDEESEGDDEEEGEDAPPRGSLGFRKALSGDLLPPWIIEA
jgi:hypothetical protein